MLSSAPPNLARPDHLLARSTETILAPVSEQSADYFGIHPVSCLTVDVWPIFIPPLVFAPTPKQRVPPSRKEDERVGYNQQLTD